MLQNILIAVQAGEDLFDPFSVLSALRFEPGFFCKQLFFLRNCFFQNLFLQLVNQMAAREGVTEQLKAQDQMLWVQRMNSVRIRATEIVNHELIYV